MKKIIRISVILIAIILLSYRNEDNWGDNKLIAKSQVATSTASGFSGDNLEIKRIYSPGTEGLSIRTLNAPLDTNSSNLTIRVGEAGATSPGSITAPNAGTFTLQGGNGMPGNAGKLGTDGGSGSPLLFIAGSAGDGGTGYGAGAGDGGKAGDFIFTGKNGGIGGDDLIGAAGNGNDGTNFRVILGMGGAGGIYWGTPGKDGQFTIKRMGFLDNPIFKITNNLNSTLFSMGYSTATGTGLEFLSKSGNLLCLYFDALDIPQVVKSKCF